MIFITCLQSLQLTTPLRAAKPKISNFSLVSYDNLVSFGFSGSERRRQPERLQTCYENHNALRITGAYLLKLALRAAETKFCSKSFRLIVGRWISWQVDKLEGDTLAGDKLEGDKMTWNRYIISIYESWVNCS